MRRTVTFLLSLTLSIVVGAALGLHEPSVDAACERVDYICPQAGPVTGQKSVICGGICLRTHDWE